MQAFSDNHTDFIPLLVGIISVIYIRIELESSIRFEMIMSIYEDYAKEKCFFEDLTEGKVSILAVSSIVFLPNYSVHSQESFRSSVGEYSEATYR